ncbi:unnamed protein product, partial [marine sediment metagenome]
NPDAWSNLGSGTVTIKFYINDSFGKIGFDEVSIRKDIDMPEITINSPTNNTAFRLSPFINLTINEPNLDKVWYTLDGGITNYTITGLTGTLNQTAWDALSEGDFNVELFANDTMGNINNLITLHLSKDITGPTITIIRPIDDKKFGRDAPVFELNITDENGVGST